MRKHPFSKLLTHALTVVGMILALWTGLASAAVDKGADSPALLKAINASPDGYQVEIAADRALTFTYYKTSNPHRAVIDLAQADAGELPKNMEVNAGIIKRINVTKHTFGAGFLSRVEIVLAADEEFTVTPNPEDKGRLVIAFTKPQAAQSVKPEEQKQDEVKVSEKAAESAPVVPAVTAAVAPASPKTAASPDAQPGKNEANAQSASPAATLVASEKSDSAVIEVTAVEALKDSIEIKIKGQVSFKSFRMNKPDRLVVDVFGAKTSIKAQAIDLNSFGVGKVRIGINPDKVRLVFDAAKDKLLPSQVTTGDAGLKVIFSPVGESNESKVKEAPIAEVPPAQTEATTVKKNLKSRGAGVVEAIDFEVKGDNSLITVTVSGSCEPGRPVKVAKGMTLTFKNCQISRKLQRFIDSGSFPSVVQGITPLSIKRKNSNDTRLIVQLRADAPNKLTQSGEKYVWEFKNTKLPPAKVDKNVPELLSGDVKPQKSFIGEPSENELAGETGVEILADDKANSFVPKVVSKKKYTGRRVSLEFSDAEVRKIFQLIAEVSNLNFLIADDVTGTISIKLVNVPWDQALDVILESKNLEMKREGNIVQIKPKGKFKSAQIEEQEAKKAQERALPLVTEIFDVNFADIGEVQAQFEKIRSERGVITKDGRTNRVIVKDVQPAIEEMKFLLKNVDMPEKQVLIEARIVEATSTFSRDLGVQWGLHYKDGSASMAGINSIDTGWGGVIGITPPTSGFNSSSTSGASMGLSFGKLTSNIQLDLRLSAAANAGLVKIVSSPKVVTLNNKQAKISQGQAIYLPSTSAEGTKQDKVDATLSLEVTPHITPDGTISMKITAKNDAPGTAPSGATAAVNKKEANTELLVKNGETTVIGGIYVDSDTESDSGVPYLMDIPLLGWFFKSNTKVKTKTELLIFITPRII
ncbi:type IV pilus secretin PilQ [Geobacter pelophilus]|uniref:Type IV pilus secretin PilQ n=1 Tax=Geoanaerobacter pelophilus TaxID=60036 RepID=A0AAW4LEQ5_9BACT|nr:type IV pilus secretin family protein [Geoanaerobacter pelophilus]MBT0665636.1 type IV pilus secretin PilQ [Geoanaerobacter pelophilus]